MKHIIDHVLLPCARNKVIAGLFAVIVFSFFSFWPILNGSYFPMHDDTQISRVIVMGKAIRQGQFPVRWVTDLGYGYGYPIFNFYAPLPYYVGGFIYAVGVDAISATKAMFIIGIMLSGITMYILVGFVLGIPAGIVGSVMYLFAPYHAVDIYIRGAVGEYYAYAILPLFVYSLFRILKPDYSLKTVLIGSVSLSGIILSHTITGYIVCGIIVLLLFLLAILAGIRKAPFLRTMTVGAVLFSGLSISAFYWLPAISEMKYTRVFGFVWDQTNPFDHFVCPLQLWTTPWEFGGSAPGCQDGMSFMLGKLHIILSVIGLIVSTGLIKRNTELKKWCIFAIIVIVGSLYFMFPISEAIWRVIPQYRYIQYPWRLLLFTSLGLSMMASVTLLGLKKSNTIQWIGAITLTGMIILYSQKWFRPQYSFVARSEHYESIEDLRFRVSRISDEYLPVDFAIPADETGIVRATIQNSRDISVRTIYESDIAADYEVTTNKAVQLKIGKAYFPGWHFFIDGESIKPEIRKSIPYIEIPDGIHRIRISFTDTPVRAMGNIISAGIVIVYLMIYVKKTIS